MKRTIALISMLACLLVLVCGCDMSNLVGSGMSQTEIYEELDNLIDDPEDSTDMTGSITFKAYIASEPFEETFDDDDTVYMYQNAYICRNVDKPMFIDVTDIENRLPKGSYATITGKVVGNIYWTEDNRQKEYLDLYVEKIEPYEVPEAQPSTENKIDVQNYSYSGSFEFLGAHYAKTSFNKYIVVYFNFTNKAGETNIKMDGMKLMLSRIDIEYNGEDLSAERNIFDVDQLRSDALDMYAMDAYTYSGKTQLYYMLIEPEAYASEDEPVWFDFFDDEFVHVNSVAVPVAKTLADLG